MGRTVISHPPPLQAHSSFRLAFLTKFYFRALISPSSISSLLSRPVSLPSFTWLVCSLISSASTLRSYPVITPQQCSDVSKLMGAVSVGSGIPIPVWFTPQVICLLMEGVGVRVWRILNKWFCKFSGWIILEVRYGKKGFNCWGKLYKNSIQNIKDKTQRDLVGKYIY